MASEGTPPAAQSGSSDRGSAVASTRSQTLKGPRTALVNLTSLIKRNHPVGSTRYWSSASGCS